jgi:hypothetical protein
MSNTSRRHSASASSLSCSRAGWGPSTRMRPHARIRGASSLRLTVERCPGSSCFPASSEDRTAIQMGFVSGGVFGKLGAAIGSVCPPRQRRSGLASIGRSRCAAARAADGADRSGVAAKPGAGRVCSSWVIRGGPRIRRPGLDPVIVIGPGRSQNRVPRQGAMLISTIGSPRQRFVSRTVAKAAPRPTICGRPRAL